MLGLTTAKAAAGDATSWSDQVVGWLLTHGLKILVILVGALILRLIAGWLIGRVLDSLVSSGRQVRGFAKRIGRRPKTSPIESAEVARRIQRVDTLRSLLRSTASLAIGVVAVLMILTELKINIAPLIASAGIVGVALGFGAQTLVKDFIAGVFMLAEDQYGVGDVVDLGEATGTVEKVALRVTQIRSIDGTLWTVRNGEILRVGNMSQGFSKALVHISLEYGQDIGVVREVLERVAREIGADPEWSSLVLDEPFIGGIDNLNGKEFTTQVSLMTLPGEQWGVARELRKRIKAAFDAEGITFSIPTPWNPAPPS